MSIEQAGNNTPEKKEKCPNCPKCNREMEVLMTTTKEDKFLENGNTVYYCNKSGGCNSMWIKKPSIKKLVEVEFRPDTEDSNAGV